MRGSRKALLLGLVIAASAVATPTIASVGVVVDIDVAPPPVRVETAERRQQARGVLGLLPQWRDTVANRRVSRRSVSALQCVPWPPSTTCALDSSPIPTDF
jgi:hypothetical protein